MRTERGKLHRKFVKHRPAEHSPYPESFPVRPKQIAPWQGSLRHLAQSFLAQKAKMYGGGQRAQRLLVQMLEVAFSRRMCCSRVASVSRIRVGLRRRWFVRRAVRASAERIFHAWRLRLRTDAIAGRHSETVGPPWRRYPPPPAAHHSQRNAFGDHCNRHRSGCLTSAQFFQWARSRQKNSATAQPLRQFPVDPRGERRPVELTGWS